MSGQIIAAGLFGAFSASFPAFLDATTKTVRLSYADLDLTTPDGRVALDRRLKDAVARLLEPASAAAISA